MKVTIETHTYRSKNNFRQIEEHTEKICLNSETREHIGTYANNTAYPNGEITPANLKRLMRNLRNWINKGNTTAIENCFN